MEASKLFLPRSSDGLYCRHLLNNTPVCTNITLHAVTTPFRSFGASNPIHQASRIFQTLDDSIASNDTPKEALRQHTLS